MSIIQQMNFWIHIRITRLQPTKITSHSNTVIDNIFSNIIDPDTMSGNFNATVSDHLPQFAIISNMFGNTASNKFNIHERD